MKSGIWERIQKAWNVQFVLDCKLDIHVLYIGFTPFYCLFVLDAKINMVNGVQAVQTQMFLPTQQGLPLSHPANQNLVTQSHNLQPMNPQLAHDQIFSQSQLPSSSMSASAFSSNLLKTPYNPYGPTELSTLNHLQTAANIGMMNHPNLHVPPSSQYNWFVDCLLWFCLTTLQSLTSQIC